MSHREYPIPLPAGYEWKQSIGKRDQRKTANTVFFQIEIARCYSDAEDEGNQMLSEKPELRAKKCAFCATEDPCCLPKGHQIWDRAMLNKVGSADQSRHVCSSCSKGLSTSVEARVRSIPDLSLIHI